MITTGAHLLLVCLLAGIFVCAFAAINQIQHAPRVIAYAWVALAIGALWLGLAIVVPSWRDCQLFALLFYVGASLWVTVVERRRAPWFTSENRTTPQ